MNSEQVNNNYIIIIIIMMNIVERMNINKQAITDKPERKIKTLLSIWQHLNITASFIQTQRTYCGNNYYHDFFCCSS